MTRKLATGQEKREWELGREQVMWWLPTPLVICLVNGISKH
jgi:hypothetical protein